MKLLSTTAAGGLLWLTFSAVGFGSTLLNITGQTNNVENGGQFSAFTGPTDTQNIFVYCVDDLNFVSVPSSFSVNVTNLSNATEVYDNTRYGQTAPSAATTTILFPMAFSTNTVVVPTNIGTAQDRYAMAAWLIEQYSFVSGNNAANNTQIQNAIWTLMDATGATYGSTGTYINQAETWITSEMASNSLTAFESGIVIYSDTRLAPESDPARYSGTAQEMIGFTTNAPEPATLAMLGMGLIAIGLLHKKRLKA
jgi:hypothetical protein